MLLTPVTLEAVEVELFRLDESDDNLVFIITLGSHLRLEICLGSSFS